MSHGEEWALDAELWDVYSDGLKGEGGIWVWRREDLYLIVIIVIVSSDCADFCGPRYANDLTNLQWYHQNLIKLYGLKML